MRFEAITVVTAQITFSHNVTSHSPQSAPPPLLFLPPASLQRRYSFTIPHNIASKKANFLGKFKSRFKAQLLVTKPCLI